MPRGAVSSWGPEAIDLAATVGLHLDQGQADIINDGTAQRAGGLWLASEIVDDEPRQNGKGSILEVRALGGLLLVKEELIVWTAHEFKTAHQGFLRMRHYFDNYDHLRKRVKTIRSSTHSTDIVLRGGQTLTFLARSGGSGRGFAGVAPLFLDEAFALKTEQMAAITYATSAHPNPQIWLMSSAPLNDSDVFRETCLRGRKGSRSMVYYEWSTSIPRKTAQDIIRQNKALLESDESTPRGRKLRAQLFDMVAEANRAFRVRISEDSILRELRSNGVEQFGRERLGLFDETEAGGRIEPEAWARLEDDQSRRDGHVSLAVDISPERDWAAISMYGHRSDKLGHAQLVDYGPVACLIERIERFAKSLDPIAIGMARGTYASIKQELRTVGLESPRDRVITEDDDPEDARKRRWGDLYVMSAGDMAAACGQIIDAVSQETLRYVPSEQLTSGVKVAKTRKHGDTVAWAPETRGVDITGLVSVTEARHVFYACADLAKEDDYDPLKDLM